MVNGIWQSLGLDLVFLNVYAFFIKILRMIQEFGPGSFFRILASAKPPPITINIPQYLGLELVNIECVCIFFSQNIPRRSRDRASFIFF